MYIFIDTNKIPKSDVTYKYYRPESYVYQRSGIHSELLVHKLQYSGKFANHIQEVPASLKCIHVFQSLYQW